MSKQKQPRRLADADVGMLGAKSSPSRSAHIGLVVSSALAGHVPSRQAHADVATPTPVDRAERANKWVVLALSGTATFMTTLDSSIVNIGLPSIARAFGVPLSGNIEWVLIGYLVVIAAVLLTFGRLADMLGRKPLFLAGLAIFTLGSALCGAAPSLGTLIAARCFQGLGAAAILCVNVAMPTPVDRAERANKWVVLALSGTATFMTTLDSSIVNIGLPSIARAFDVPLSGNIEWVIIGYLVVIAAVLLTFGRLADMLGRKPLF
ncbi:MAG: hypothetical protein QOF07_2832, partial [Bradyrhizobium sp.]|nr:hypothetical protein [Bradyrhizobium sp.]